MSEGTVGQTSSEPAGGSDAGSGVADDSVERPDQLIADLKRTVSEQTKLLKDNEQYARFGKAISNDPQLLKSVRDQIKQRKEAKQAGAATDNGASLTKEEIREIFREEIAVHSEMEKLNAWASEQYSDFAEVQTDPMFNAAYNMIDDLVGRGEIEKPSGIGRGRFVLREAYKMFTNHKGGAKPKKEDAPADKKAATAAGSSGSRAGASEDKSKGGSEFSSEAKDRMNAILANRNVKERV